MNEFTLPARLDNVEDIGVGAVIKHIDNDNRRGIIIDFIGSSPKTVIVEVDKKRLKSLKLPKRPNHYRITILEKESDWIALTMGGDELLIE